MRDRFGVFPFFLALAALVGFARFGYPAAEGYFLGCEVGEVVCVAAGVVFWLGLGLRGFGAAAVGVIVGGGGVVFEGLRGVGVPGRCFRGGRVFFVGFGDGGASFFVVPFGFGGWGSPGLFGLFDMFARSRALVSGWDRLLERKKGRENSLGWTASVSIPMVTTASSTASASTLSACSTVTLVASTSSAVGMTVLTESIVCGLTAVVH